MEGANELAMPGAAGIFEYQRAQMEQQRRRKMIVTLTIIACMFFVMSHGAKTSQYQGNASRDKLSDYIMTNEELAEKILDQTRSSADGYSKLIEAFYQRSAEEQADKANLTPDLLGNSAKELLFGTLYSLRRKIFQGQWTLQQGYPLIGFLENNNGRFGMVISEKNKTQVNIILQISDDEYIDHKQMICIIDFPRQTNFTVQDDGQIVIQNLTLHYYLQDELQKISTKKEINEIIPVNMTIILGASFDQDKYINKWSPMVSISLTNANTNLEEKLPLFQLTANADLEEESQESSRETMFYSIFLSTILAIQFCFSIQLLKSFVLRANEETKFSLLCLAIAFVWDGFFCFLHLIYAIYFDHQFSFFVTPCFLYMILWSIFERCLISFIWRSRQSAVQDENAINKKRILFFVTLYSALVLAFFLVQQVITKQWFVYLSQLYLVPQIIRNARRGQQVRVSKAFVFGFMAIRSLLILYFRGYSANVIHLSPQYDTCAMVVAIVLLQVCILYAQEYLGPRFFIPARFQTDCYNYYWKLPAQDIENGQTNNGCEECIICIGDLSIHPVIDTTGNFLKRFIIKTKQQQNYIMKTPCGHKYHIPCLLTWMEVKMECPTCRAPLPPPV